MDYFDVMDRRRSIRAFKDQPVEAEKSWKILEALNQAPSAGNLQAYEVYLVCDARHKLALVEASGGQEFLAQAPLVLVFCVHPDRSTKKYGKRGAELYCIQDAAIACAFAMLAATALGLSTVWVGAFDEEAVRQIIDAPQAHRPVAMLPIGYAAEVPESGSRRSLTDLVHQV
ncbi:nitroreductase [Chloroflexi bacterium CFX6]|nr:nitroreductase [Chloroflexi bacterium CFX6]